MRLVNKSCMGFFGLTQVEKHFVFSLPRDWFGQNKLRYNQFLCWYGRVLVNSSEKQFFSPHEREGFGQHGLRCVLYPRIDAF